MSLDGASRHVQLLGDFVVVATLQQQFGNLLLSWTQLGGLFPHGFSPGIKFRIAPPADLVVASRRIETRYGLRNPHTNTASGGFYKNS